jgi:aspartokinase/homoserine dehydrogenase 1
LVETKGVPADLSKFTAHMQSHSFPNSVIIDCTASARVAEAYYDWVKKGIHIITPNKKANSGPFDQVLLAPPLSVSHRLHFIILLVPHVVILVFMY